MTDTDTRPRTATAPVLRRLRRRLRAAGPPTIVRIGPTSWVVRPRMVATVTSSAVVAFVLFLLSITISEYPVNALDVLRIIVGGGTRVENVVILDDAVPRATVAVLVGFALAMSGSLTQLIAQNPLATPDLLGVTAGAGTAAVATIAFSTTSWGSWLAGLGIPTAALIGGLGTAAVMYVLAWPGRKANSAINPMRLVLIGVGVTWVLQAATSFLLTRAEVRDVARAQVWLVGSVTNASWSQVWPVALAVGAGVVGVAVLARQIDALGLGNDIARGLGVRTFAVSSAILLIAVVVAALAVSAAGPIAFVALLAPQIAMRMSHSAIPTPLASGMVGSILVVGGDILCRTVLPSGLPVGIVTAALGGPFLIYLMVTISRKATV
ncbi:MAG: iron ABC transporter permease [Gordonia sp. (in: high G+C Gram-positive bacteria)]